MSISESRRNIIKYVTSRLQTKNSLPILEVYRYVTKNNLNFGTEIHTLDIVQHDAPLSLVIDYDHGLIRRA